MDLQINSFQHLGIPVSDLKQSEIFYEGLGFKNVMTSSFEMEGDKGFVSMMQRSYMVIEIYQLPKKFLSEIHDRKDGHIDHIAFDVDDIDIVFKTLTENGYQIIEKEPTFLPYWKNGCKYFNISGPDGEKLEFNQIL